MDRPCPRRTEATKYHQTQMPFACFASDKFQSGWIAAHAVWIGFHLVLLLLLAAELVFSRLGTARLSPAQRLKRQHRNAVAATAMWVLAAAVCGFYIAHSLGTGLATQFAASYAIEESLSVDNLFLFLLLFQTFGVPPVAQPRVLFWGVLGAILMRGAFIAGGLGLLARFQWVSYAFAVILLIAAVRLVLPSSQGGAEAVPGHQPLWIRWVARIHPVSMRYDRFFTRENGTRMVTMLFLALVAIEVSDVVFALDSIPAVLSITRHPFIAYASNILAVMGLRSLFFLLANALRKLRFLHFGLAVVLAFAAAKMLAAGWVDVSPVTSLMVIAMVLAITVATSLMLPQRQT